MAQITQPNGPRVAPPQAPLTIHSFGFPNTNRRVLPTTPTSNHVRRAPIRSLHVSA